MNNTLTFWIRVCTPILPGYWQSAESKHSRAWFLAAFLECSCRFVMLVAWQYLTSILCNVICKWTGSSKHRGKNTALILPVYILVSVIPLSKLKSKARVFFHYNNEITMKKWRIVVLYWQHYFFLTSTVILLVTDNCPPTKTPLAWPSPAVSVLNGVQKTSWFWPVKSPNRPDQYFPIVKIQLNRVFIF